MIEIPLNDGHIALIDDENCKLIRRHRWKAEQHGKMWYAVTSLYAPSRHRTKKLYMHVFLLSRKGIDHKDRNGLNNQRSNLRSATASQNQANTGLSRRNTSGYKGVSFNKTRNKWCAGIRVQGRYIRLGCYPTSKEAALAYNEAAIKYFGEFAWLNPV